MPEQWEVPGLEVVPGQLSITLGLGSAQSLLVLAGEAQDPVMACLIKLTMNVLYSQLN